MSETKVVSCNVSLLKDLDNNKNCSGEAAAAIRYLEQRIAQLDEDLFNALLAAGQQITTLQDRIAELEKACDASARWHKFQKRGGIENATAMAETIMVDYLRAAGYLLEKK